MPSSTTISIAMPIYNEEKFLRHTLDSILSQTFKDFRLTISDNASTDSTGDICREYAKRDSRIQYFRNPKNIGSIRNMENTFKKCSGNFIFFTSGHDQWASNFLEECITYYQENPETVLVYAKGQWIEQNGEIGGTLGFCLDTIGQSRKNRFCNVVRNIEPYAIYGLYRKNVIDQIFPIRNSLGPDLLVLAELSLMGTFGCVQNTSFYMRRTYDIAHLKKHLAKFHFQTGPVKSPLMCLRFFIHLCAIIRKRCDSRRTRLYLYPRACWAIWKRWHRLFISILIAGISPDLLDWIQRKRGKAAAMGENDTL